LRAALRGTESLLDRVRTALLAERGGCVLAAATAR
jgi:hypothetical protein